jgi:hypothetical protein
VLTQPVGELAPTDAAGRKLQHELLLLGGGGIDLRAIEDKERLHGGVPHAFVAVHEWMILDEREAKAAAFSSSVG